MLFVLIACCTFAQTNKDSSHFTQVTHIKTSLKHFTTDKLRQFYIVSPTNELIKYSREGKELFRYNNNWLGELAIVDATNPFNLFLYYPEYMTVITLDRTLNETSTFNFFDLDLTDVRAVGMSNDNNIWLYDDLRFTLKKIDRQGNVLLESGNLNLTLGHRIAPNAIVERNNQVFINDPENGILVFDNFANYLQTLPLKNLEYFQVQEDLLSYQKDHSFRRFDLRSLLTYTIKIPEAGKKAQQIRIQDKHLYFSDKSGLWVFEKQP